MHLLSRFITQPFIHSGYDALLPFKDAVATQSFPYTPNWHGVRALAIAAASILDKDDRHLECMQLCRSRSADMGLELYIPNAEHASPSVTAVVVPSWTTWPALGRALRARGASNHMDD